MDNADKYQGKYRIPSARWQQWDYGANAAYFVTICTAQRERFFGEIVQDEMQLSEIGQIAYQYWLQIPAHFPFAVLDQFVIMPNHVHGIIVINKPETDDVVVDADVAAVETPNLGVFTIPPQNAAARWYSGTLGVIVNQYKRACTMYARLHNIPFAWQTRFHDRVIRDNDEWQRISEYIYNNPQNWNDDELF
jgi:REP element-mobilizing transposase RayT